MTSFQLISFGTLAIHALAASYISFTKELTSPFHTIAKTILTIAFVGTLLYLRLGRPSSISIPPSDEADEFVRRFATIVHTNDIDFYNSPVLEEEASESVLYELHMRPYTPPVPPDQGTIPVYKVDSIKTSSVKKKRVLADAYFEGKLYATTWLVHQGKRASFPIVVSYQVTKLSLLDYQGAYYYPSGYVVTRFTYEP